MSKVKPTDVVAKMVSLLTPLTSEERARVVSASLTLLGETAVRMGGGQDDPDHGGEDAAGTVATQGKAKLWQKQNGVSPAQLTAAFHLEDGTAEYIADVPGKNNRAKALNAYVLTGLAKMLAGGEAKFSDKDARALCTSAGCYDPTNHAKALKEKGSLFTGSKEKGWTLTAPGLKHAAGLVRSLSPAQE